MVIGTCLPEYRHNDFLKFHETVDSNIPVGLEIRRILDNHATHKHASVKAWLTKNPRFHLHFTHTSPSWLNLVERWFRELTDKALRHRIFHSVPDLIEAIEDYLDSHSDEPKPGFGTRPPTASSKRSSEAASHSK